MKALGRHNRGTCYACTENATGDKHHDSKCITDWTLERAYFLKRRGTEIRDVWECSQCGELVPIDSWTQYQKTGDIVVREQKEGKSWAYLSQVSQHSES